MEKGCHSFSTYCSLFYCVHYNTSKLFVFVTINSFRLTHFNFLLEFKIYCYKKSNKIFDKTYEECNYSDKEFRFPNSRMITNKFLHEDNESTVGSKVKERIKDDMSKTELIA